MPYKLKIKESNYFVGVTKLNPILHTFTYFIFLLIDLQTVMKRLTCRYYLKLSELVGDVSLIFDNCRQYNGVDSKLIRCAEIVETVFVGKIRDLRGRSSSRR